MPLNTDISYTLIFKTYDTKMNYQFKTKLAKLMKYVQIFNTIEKPLGLGVKYIQF